MPMGVPMHPRTVRPTSLLVIVALAFGACAGSSGRATATQSTSTASANANALAAVPQVRVRIGDGPVSQPIPHPAFARATVALQFPQHAAGKNAAIVVEKETDGAFAEWLRFSPRIQQDGTLKVAGLADGRYRIAARCGDVDYEGECSALRGEPVEVALREVAAAPTR